MRPCRAHDSYILVQKLTCIKIIFAKNQINR